MAISGYIGIPGSGKSYECVANVLLPAVLSGRRVITNIIGVVPDVVYDYCVDVLRADRDALGILIVVDDDAMKKRDFFPYKGRDGLAVADTFCKPGDLIIADEIHRLWDKDSAICNEHRSFFAEHRHFTDAETGISCDFVFMNQSLATVARFIKDRTSKTFRMTKLTALGLSKRYRVDVFEGVRLTKSSRIQSYQCSYKKEIFPLYKSYDGVNGNEQTVDKRESVLQPKFVFLYILLPLAFICFGVYYTIKFFSLASSPSETADAAVTQTTAAAGGVSQVPPTPPPPPRPVVSADWRIGGRLVKNNIGFIVLINTDGRVRTEPLTSFTFNGLFMSGEIDNEKITVWSGQITKGASK
ncbi:zonular occludens toxin domain-containing protein [Citrobacter meridianamericanus]|uniref:zonular occludens toxin domain-containing protein n=1 Tax=Citrobacter meridianamericanus TaxID=2894201 RepID=UPI00351D753A